MISAFIKTRNTTKLTAGKIIVHDKKVCKILSSIETSTTAEIEAPENKKLTVLKTDIKELIAEMGPGNVLPLSFMDYQFVLDANLVDNGRVVTIEKNKTGEFARLLEEGGLVSVKSIIDAYTFLRTNNSSIPDATLDFMKDASLEKLRVLEVEALVEGALEKYPSEVKLYKEGKSKSMLGLFVGEVMKNSKNAADPNLVKKTILEKLI